MDRVTTAGPVPQRSLLGLPWVDRGWIGEQGRLPNQGVSTCSPHVVRATASDCSRSVSPCFVATALAVPDHADVGRRRRRPSRLGDARRIAAERARLPRRLGARLPGHGPPARCGRGVGVHRRRPGRLVGVEGRPRRHVGPQLRPGRQPAARPRRPGPVAFSYDDTHTSSPSARPTRPRVSPPPTSARRPLAARRPHPRAVLLRDDRPLRQRRPDQRPRRPHRVTGSTTGFDPTDKGFYHGGDLQGLIIDKLDYIEGLGTTAIWLTPSFKNKPVQGTGAERQRRLPRLLDHRLHPDRPAPRHQRRPERP